MILSSSATKRFTFEILCKSQWVPKSRSIAIWSWIQERIISAECRNKHVIPADDKHKCQLSHSLFYLCFAHCHNFIEIWIGTKLLWSWTCFKKNHIYLKMLCLYLIGEQSALLDDIALCSLTSSQNQLFSPLPWMALHLSFCLFLFAGPSPWQSSNLI